MRTVKQGPMPYGLKLARFFVDSLLQVLCLGSKSPTLVILELKLALDDFLFAPQEPNYLKKLMMLALVTRTTFSAHRLADC